MKHFLFLYPIPEIINFEIKSFKEDLKQKYKSILNKCIDLRYRQRGFVINYAVFNGSLVSDIINLQKSDRIIEVGLDFKTHTTEQPTNQYLYPNPDCILNQLANLSIIRIAGFHMWDCVDKLAKRAYERGINTLVDEDLTEFLNVRMRDPNFKSDILRPLKVCPSGKSSLRSEDGVL